MTELELEPEQIAAVDELRAALETFAVALEGCRETGLGVAASFRAAGVEIPSFIPDALLENLIPAPASPSPPE